MNSPCRRHTGKGNASKCAHKGDPDNNGTESHVNDLKDIKCVDTGILAAIEIIFDLNAQRYCRYVGSEEPDEARDLVCH
jgi:hypothetical protein